MSEKSEATRFKKGRSGNPSGKPKGARNHATLAAEALLDGEAEELTRKAIEVAKEGNPIALRLVLDRILPPRKDRPLRIDLPKLASASDATAAMATIAAAVSVGEISPGQGADLNAVVSGFIRTVELTEVERRLAEVEKRLAGDGK